MAGFCPVHIRSARGRGLLHQHHGDAVTDRVAQTALLAHDEVATLLVFDPTPAGRADQDPEESVVDGHDALLSGGTTPQGYASSGSQAAAASARVSFSQVAPTSGSGSMAARRRR